MDCDGFWRLIEASRVGEDGLADMERLHELLEGLETNEVLDFDRELWERMRESYRWDLWAVAYIVNGGCSDDGFDYFRGWLIAQGRAYFEASLREPERAADRAEPDANECEDMLYTAARVHKERTGEFPPPLNVMPEDGPAGTAWTEEELEELYPELCERFT
jgi:hypothetical protein